MCGFVVCECGASGGCVPWCGDVCVVVSHGLKCAALVTACRVAYRVIRRRQVGVGATCTSRLPVHVYVVSRVAWRRARRRGARGRSARRVGERDNSLTTAPKTHAHKVIKNIYYIYY